LPALNFAGGTHPLAPGLGPFNAQLGTTSVGLQAVSAARTAGPLLPLTGGGAGRPGRAHALQLHGGGRPAALLAPPRGRPPVAPPYPGSGTPPIVGSALVLDQANKQEAVTVYEVGLCWVAGPNFGADPTDRKLHPYVRFTCNGTHTQGTSFSNVRPGTPGP